MGYDIYVSKILSGNKSRHNIFIFLISISFASNYCAFLFQFPKKIVLRLTKYNQVATKSP